MQENKLVILLNKIIFSKEEYIKNCFWSPRLITVPKDGKYPGKHYGYTLYIYGGHAMDLYWVEEEEVIYGNLFSKTYYPYFGENQTIAKDIVKSFSQFIVSGADFLVGWNKWDAIFEAFINRDFVERKRENCILCRNARAGEEFEVFGMEFTTNINDIVAKADLVWLSYDRNNMPIISLIEYKCTDGAVKKDSGYNLTDHFKKMVTYYHLKSVKEALVKLLNMKRELKGEAIFDDNTDTIHMNFGFYFTHINPIRNRKYDKGITEGNVKRRIYEMITDNEDKYKEHMNDIYFMFGDDENTKLTFSRKIHASDIKYDTENDVWDSIKSVAI